MINVTMFYEDGSNTFDDAFEDETVDEVIAGLPYSIRESFKKWGELPTSIFIDEDGRTMFSVQIHDRRQANRERI